MKSAYLSKLQHDTRLLVHKIEQYIADEINIKIDQSRKDILACEVDKYGATILIPDADFFPDASALHELLHIRRFCLDKEPRLVVCDNHWTPVIETAITKLDNNLEHFVIIPQELKLRPERIYYWQSCMNKELENFYSSNDIKDDQERRALTYWAFIKHVLPENELIQKASMLIENLGITDRASQFFDAIIPYIDVKDKLVKVCFKHLDLPDDIGCLEYIDCKNKLCYEKPLANIKTV